MGSIIANIEYQKTGRKTYMYRDLPENVLENENFQNLQDLLVNFSQIKGGDLVRKANWGLYKGSPVIIDLGFTDVSAKLYGF